MIEQAPRYWFRAKRYGWGWGLPLTWQGWAVLVGYGGLIVLTSELISPATNPVAFGACILLLSAVLIGICYAKGEPARWRWGDR